MASWEITTANSSLEFDTFITQINRCFKIDDNHFVNAWTGLNSHGAIQSFVVNTSTWAVTTAAANAWYYYTNPGTTKTGHVIGDNHVLLFFKDDSGDGRAQVFTVNTSTWTISAAGSALEFDTQDFNYADSVEIDSTHFAVFYAGLDFDGYAQVVEVNTSTWAVTTASAMLEFDTSYGFYHSASMIDENHIIDFYGAESDDGYVQVFEVNTTTWAITTASARLEFDTQRGYHNSCVQVDSNHFVNFWEGTANATGWVQAFEVDTSTWAVTTAASSLEFSTDMYKCSYNHAHLHPDGEHIIHFWCTNANYGQVQTFEVNTSTWAVTTSASKLQYTTSIGDHGDAVFIDNSHIISFFDGPDNDGFVQVFEIEVPAQEYTKTVTAKAKIKYEKTNTTTAKARIFKEESKTVTAKANIFPRTKMRQVWMQVFAMNDTSTHYIHPQTAWKTDNGEHAYADYNTTESETQMVVPQGGTISNLYFHMQNDETPGTSKSWTVTVRKNGIDTDLDATISGSETSGNSGSEELSVVAGDKISLSVTSSGSPGVQYGSFSLEYEGGYEDYSIISGGMRSGSSTIYGPFGLYCPYNYTVYDADACLAKAPFNFTIKAIYVNLATAPGAGTSRAIAIRRDTSTLATVTVSDTDTENSSTGLNISVSEGDNLGVMQTLSGSPASSRVRYSVLIQAENDGYSWIAAGQGSSWGDAQVGFLGAATDSSSEYKWYAGPTTFTLGRLYQKNDLLGAGASRDVTVEKNGEDTSLTCTCAELSRDANNTTDQITFNYGDYANLYVDTTNDTEEGVITLAQYIMTGGHLKILDAKAKIIKTESKTATAKANIFKETAQAVTAKGYIVAAPSATIEAKARLLAPWQIPQPRLNETLLPYPSKATIKRMKNQSSYTTIRGKDKRDTMGEKYQYTLQWDVMKPHYFDPLLELVKSGEIMLFTYKKWPQSADGVEVLGRLGPRKYVTGTGTTDYWSSVSLTLTEVYNR